MVKPAVKAGRDGGVEAGGGDGGEGGGGDGAAETAVARAAEARVAARAAAAREVGMAVGGDPGRWHGRSEPQLKQASGCYPIATQQLQPIPPWRRWW